ncbi:hypothetical protein GC096_18940 [Paenibacillus sp. LMG 31461]|uniref:Uncharacterized protein n=1 Tax=Paenibacillus plantarum TaxID=2654975 RepID=A0ABX1XCD3_9BACL|nr:hypothetical protein [Paenibacillus plantarum]NOU66117.1 hypothetical protein [Paenibacillus plantarum]
MTTLTFNGNPLTILLEDVLGHPYFEWPTTLVSYPLILTSGVDPSTLRLTDMDTGHNVMFQLSPPDLSRGGAEVMLRFMTDLPSAGRRAYQLSVAEEREAAQRDQGDEIRHARVQCTLENDLWIIDNGRIQLAIPCDALSQSTSLSERMLVYQIGRGGVWQGVSYLYNNGSKASMRCAIVENGPLQVVAQITCLVDEAAYVITLKMISGMDFVEVDEQMDGFSDEDDVHLCTEWIHFHPTHRYAPNRPFNRNDRLEGFQRYPFEEIDRQVTDTHIELRVHASGDSKLPFCLLPYEPWQGFERLNMATFWDSRAMDSVGIYIRNPERWNDGQYSIWSSGKRLAVQYHYNENRLSWKHPIRNGSRSTAVCCYDHQRDIAEVERLDRIWREAADRGQACPRGPSSYTLWLQQWYSLLSLDKIKDWVLTYPSDGAYPESMFETGTIATVAELESMLRNSELVNGLALYGPRQDQGFSPVPTRAIYDEWIDAYHRLREQMTGDERRRITGMYLLMAYLHASEDYMPLQTMLSGHPNFLSDVRGVPALMAVFFPEHPCAREWVEQFDRSLEWNMRVHTRSDQEQIDSRGGRWTENVACYVWAFLKPVMKTAHMLKYFYTGDNHLLTEEMPKLARWILNSLASPSIDLQAGVEQQARLLLPQGAHARRRVPPWSFRQLGHELIQYDPMTAEAILWATSPDDSDFEASPASAWKFMQKRYSPNRGTKPRLTSCKYTGYGIVLRAGVGTPEEAFVMLQQLDKGYNYRWGISGQGGCGVLYYYAGGKAFSHNGHEDVGDDRLADTDLCTNFGIFKKGAYRSIGPNSLHRPLVDLGAASFAEIVSAKEDAYAWPEYASRSVMMVGTDYIVVYDAVFNSSVYRRFSWFVHKEETFPHIHPVYGNVTKRTELATGMTRGMWLDGTGDFMTVITPYESVNPQTTGYGCSIMMPNGNDMIFRRQKPFRWEEAESAFEGRAGWIRRRAEGVTLAILAGSYICCGPFSISVDGEAEGAVQATFDLAGRFIGRCQTNGPITLTIRIHADSLATIDLAGGEIGMYINGTAVPVQIDERDGLQIIVSIEAKGSYVLEWSEAPVPMVPEVRKAVQVAGGAVIHWKRSSVAVCYRVETSSDHGERWTVAGLTNDLKYRLHADGHRKQHVRITALTGLSESEPSADYPVYYSDLPPSVPQGLRVRRDSGNAVELAWGQMLGVEGYKLYVRFKDEDDFRLLWEGEDTFYRHQLDGESCHSPTYAVSCWNGLGESLLVYDARQAQGG